MKTDVLEKDGNYLLEMDLPGFSKHDVRAQIHGYLTIQVREKLHPIKKMKMANMFSESAIQVPAQGNIYVGEHVTQEDIKASFENGTLKLTFPKMTPERMEAQKKYITNRRIIIK